MKPRTIITIGAIVLLFTVAIALNTYDLINKKKETKKCS